MRIFVLNAAFRTIDTGEEFDLFTVATPEDMPAETRRTRLLAKVNKDSFGWAGPFTPADMEGFESEIVWCEELVTLESL